MSVPAMAWTIDGNKVYIDNSKAYISAEPHTIYESGWVYFTIISKTYSGNVDIAFGFDIENVQPKKAERLNGAGWVNIANKFDSTYWNHDGFNKWYYATNLPVVAGNTYTVRVWVDIPISTSKISGKYGFAIKSSAQTLQQAKDTGNLYYLDPWFNASWSARKNITITTNGTSIPSWYPVKLNISYQPEMQTDFDDIRFINLTNGELDYWIESYINSSYAVVWLNLSDAITYPGSDTVWLYYGNADVVNTSDGVATFSFFDDFDSYTVGTFPSTKWSQYSGTMTVEYENGVSGNKVLKYGSAGVALATMTNIQNRSVHSMLKGAYGLDELVLDYASGSVHYYIAPGYSNNLNMVRNTVIVATTPYSITTNWKNCTIKRFSSTIYGTADSTTLQYVDGSPNSVASVGVRLNNAGEIVDNFFVRKYIANEPTYTIAAPENYPITSWTNNYTNNQDLSFSLTSNTQILFNITPRYSDSISWYVNGVDQSNAYDNLSVLIDDVGVTNITATVTNASWVESVSWLVTLSTQLITPVNGSTVYNPYPPAAPEVTFAWTTSGFPYYNLQISTDPYFNYIVSSTYHSAETADIYLLSDLRYYWKIRTYADAYTPGDWSGTSSFNLTSNYSLSGLTGIAGIVYEKKSNGDLLPISDANVYIRNEALNWSSSQITGTNGYYLFDNLTNATVYSISAKATGYEDSQTEYVTTVASQRLTKNIMLSKCISGFNCFYNQQYVKFKVQTLFGTKYPDVTVTIYKGSELTASDTGTTGTDGSVTFLLTKDQQYRITFVSTTYGINREITIIPINTEYIIIITALDEDWEDYSTSIKDTIFMNVSKAVIDDTNANITVSYLDLLGGTTALTVYLNQTNVSGPLNQTVVQSWTTTGNGTHNFSISPYSGQQYLIHFKAAHSTYGNLEKTYSIFFEKVAGITGIPTVALMWFAVICLVITGAIFTTSTAEFGSIIICGEAWIFLMLGFLAPLGNALTIGTALTLASVISIMSYFSMKSKREGYS